MRTNEEVMIAKTVCRILGLGHASEKKNFERTPKSETPSTNAT